MNTALLSSLFACFAFIAGGVAEAEPPQQPPVTTCNEKTQLCIGVRSDARPFSYRSSLPGEKASDAARGPLERAGYTGYMVRICDAALAEMILDAKPGELTFNDIGIYDIDEAREKEASAGAATVAGKDATTNNTISPINDSRFLDLGVKFDILCDPATITNERRNGFMVSAPLFLTGISYITRKGEDPPDKICSYPKKPLIGLVGGTTAQNEGINALLIAHELPKFEDALIDYLRGDPLNPDSKPLCGEGTENRVKSYSGYTAAANAFCHDDFHYFVGDLEIITENVKMIPGCAYDNGTRTYTNDRYAVFGKARPENDDSGTARQLLVASFFEFLSQKVVFNPSILDKAFGDTFQGATPSHKLDVFYWSVRGERE
ncbi:transporter substrate-binding domain-containing protein (plasmid) [Rhizobium sp. CB3171]|uniref:transporter substrate-binding domain-containing protein n=1 Tax=Rhizobium sp. CB3171 TaxID=3039157 RepID=UPI0024B127E5|nr:transporter substrate-binding domain-containing protein [Rhizobium sp. CB3171]WFU04251.1 transporter substrate-binding domain-containing protein [Rhizobium sp. CB3171]